MVEAVCERHGEQQLEFYRDGILKLVWGRVGGGRGRSESKCRGLCLKSNEFSLK
jgi:hypothetical protein